MTQFPFPSRELCMEELLRDRLAHYIPQKDRSAIVDASWARGVAAARQVFSTPATTPEAVFESLGFTISRVERDCVYGNTRRFAECTPTKKHVCVYTTSVRLWCEHHGLLYADGEAIILAHELFHCIESGLQPTPREIYTVYPARLWKWGLFPSSIPAVSEIGAHAFAYTYSQRAAGSSAQAHPSKDAPAP